MANIVGQTVVNSINTYNKNKFYIRFSNFPNFTNKEIDMNIFNLYLYSFTIPDISITMLNSQYLHHRQLHPNPTGERDLQTLTCEFQIDEEQKNWYAFYAWAWYMRHGQPCGKMNLKNEELLRMDCIDTIEIVHNNNNNEIISKMKFEHCILNNISSLVLNCQDSEIATFTVTFDVESLDLELFTEEE